MAKRNKRIKISNATRKQVLSAWYENETGHCLICGLPDYGNGKGESGLQAGHIVSYFNGGPNTVDNLFPQCGVCNNLQQDTTASPDDITPLKEGDSIKERRVEWVNVLNGIKRGKDVELINDAKQWLEDGRKFSTVWKRLAKLTSQTKADELIREVV